MTVLRVMASRHSAFYSPLLGAIAGGFLQQEGFEPTYAPLPPGKTVAQLLTAGEIDRWWCRRRKSETARPILVYPVLMAQWWCGVAQTHPE